MFQITQDEINESLKRASERKEGSNNRVRILFSPTQITPENFDYVCDAYSNIDKNDYDVAVIVESKPASLRKKLQMPSQRKFKTKFGVVEVDDRLRNEFCDEDDDFFIEDEAYSKKLSLYDQLTILQHRLDDFKVVSLQITEESTFIVKELAAAFEEILASRNAVIVFCCDIHQLTDSQFDTIIEQYNDQNYSGLMNSLNSEEIKMSGLGAFFAGLLIADKWGLQLHFNHGEKREDGVTAVAEVKEQPIFG